MKYAGKTTQEWCPLCDTEVYINNCMQVQTCSSCKKDIMPCSVCHDEGIEEAVGSCDKCPIGANDADKTCNKYLVSVSLTVYADNQEKAIEFGKKIIAADGYKHISITQTGRKHDKKSVRRHATKNRK